MSLLVTSQVGTINLSSHFVERAKQRLGVGPDSLQFVLENTIEPSDRLKSVIESSSQFHGVRSNTVSERKLLVGTNYLILLTKHKRLPHLQCGRKTAWTAKTLIRLKDPVVLGSIALELMAS